MIGALCATGVPPWFMVAHSMGEVFEGVVDAHGRPASEADRSAGALFELHRALRRSGPAPGGSPCAPSPTPGATRPRPCSAAGSLAACSPPSRSRRPSAASCPSGWSPHPNLWVVACDYETGRRVPFGREDAPEADLADAVAASCAHPRLLPPPDDRRAPLRRRRHLLDLEPRRTARPGARPRDLPQPDLHPSPGPGGDQPAEWFNIAMRNASGRRLGSEAKKLRADGTDVILIQPTGEDLAVMGPNLMSAKRRNEAIEVARRTVAAQLAEPRQSRAARRPAAGRPAQDQPPLRTAPRVARLARAPARTGGVRGRPVGRPLSDAGAGANRPAGGSPRTSWPPRRPPPASTVAPSRSARRPRR